MSTLTDLEAFKALALFLELHAAHDDTAQTLFLDVELGPDGHPQDPASWFDWQRCVRMVRGEETSDESLRVAEIANRGPISLLVVRDLAAHPVDGADRALLEGLGRTDPSDIVAIRTYLVALKRLQVSLPSEVHDRLADTSDPAIRELLSP